MTKTLFSKLRWDLCFKNTQCFPLLPFPIYIYTFFLTLSGFGQERVRKCQDTARKSVCSHSVSGPIRSRRELDSQESVCFHLISRPLLQTYKVRVRCQTSGCWWKKNLEPLEIFRVSSQEKYCKHKGKRFEETMMSQEETWKFRASHATITTSFILSKARSLFCKKSYISLFKALSQRQILSCTVQSRE